MPTMRENMAIVVELRAHTGVAAKLHVWIDARQRAAIAMKLDAGIATEISYAAAAAKMPRAAALKGCAASPASTAVHGRGRPRCAAMRAAPAAVLSIAWRHSCQNQDRRRTGRQYDSVHRTLHARVRAQLIYRVRAQLGSSKDNA
jgi:hypothetical protein